MNHPVWLPNDATPEQLPDVARALEEPNGLLAMGGRLTPDFLLAAYRRGIFPWFDDDLPILWWSPDPRHVIRPQAVHVSRSLRRTMRQWRFQLSCDQAFAAVIDGCAAPRPGATGTWITAEMRDAYVQLHKLGWAHSFEAWAGTELVGGMYGIAIGEVFFGESMFSRATDASKVALVKAAGFFVHTGVQLIDCQLPSAHLERLGAVPMPRSTFIAELGRLCATARPPGRWTDDFAAVCGPETPP